MRFLAAGSVAAALVAAGLVSVRAQQNPTFKTNVNMLAVDALVVDRLGEPILGLTPADFVVKINSQVRKIVSADLIRYSTTDAAASPAAPSANTPSREVIRTPGVIPDNTRTIVLAIDEPSFLIDEIKPAVRAAQAFIRKLDPKDIVGLYVYPYANSAVDMTHDHGAVIERLDKTIGRRDRSPGGFNLGAADIIGITSGDGDALRMAQDRECSKSDAECRKQIHAEANWIGAMYETEGARRVVAISELITGLGSLPGHKTLIVLSAGLMSASGFGGRPDFRQYMARLGELAARANVQPYFIHMDNSFEQLMSAQNRPSPRPDLRFRSAVWDAAAWASGLERMAGESGGTYLLWKAGTGAPVFDRVLRETSAYYLLGVEPAAQDWDGRALLVNVKTTVKGATVRALRQVIAR